MKEKERNFTLDTLGQVWQDDIKETIKKHYMQALNAQVEIIRHADVDGNIEHYLRVTNEKGKTTRIVVGKKALEAVKEIVKPKANEMANKQK